ncbi:hypothetical protein [Methanoplanus endosymbiosus]|uniref:Uncharacterized protein n=1 Tax=Methanoplanus endosymbiosus TaxID=33865 RepID=A0A9E7PM79_9EURY|nr:hypothetical protein [Methanoplanus endosymbiosus]UUX92780.1 hypothetical protein L6E24_01225 [Methanoplanus endosymbiosus]
MSQKKGKKNDTDWQKTLSRVFIVFILISCVVGFSLTFSFFSVFKKVEKGDFVIVDYTLNYQEGIPIISSDRNIVQSYYEKGFPVALSEPLVIQAGALADQKLFPVDAYVYPDGIAQYAVFDLEMDAVSTGVEGMSSGGVKKIDLDFASTLTRNMTAEEYNMIGGNFSSAQVGMVVPLAFGYTPDEEAENSTMTLERPSVITEKTDDGIVLQYGYSVVGVTVTEIR